MLKTSRIRPALPVAMVVLKTWPMEYNDVNRYQQPIKRHLVEVAMDFVKGEVHEKWLNNTEMEEVQQKVRKDTVTEEVTQKVRKKGTRTNKKMEGKQGKVVKAKAMKVAMKAKASEA